jgi:hypothetical protein
MAFDFNSSAGERTVQDSSAGTGPDSAAQRKRLIPQKERPSMTYLTPGILRQFSQDPSGKPSIMPQPTPIVFEAAAQPKWEYHAISIDPREESPLDEGHLSKLGQDGWLLAGIIGTPGGDRVTRITYYFVRSA